MERKICSWLLIAIISAAALMPGGARAEDAKKAAEAPSASAATEHAPPPGPELDKADQAWMLVSSALVLFMTAPGLAMFYCGLVRKKNVLSVMMQCMFLMGLMTVIWALYGYSLSFGGTPVVDGKADGDQNYNKWIGNGEYLFMKNVQPTFESGAPVYPLEGTISRLTHMLFQGMFFIITPALICGAYAERMKFSAMVVYSALWGTFIYCPLCHWVWDGGILAFGSPHAIFGALDFAGGTVVHISSGISALVCAIFIGKRIGFGSEPMPPHNLTYTVIGAAMLWFGWFGFNAGSALNAGHLAASAFTATHFAAAAAALSWPAMEWIKRGHPSVLGAASGAVAGLVCITPASGYVQPMPAIIMGLIVGVVCYLACTKMKNAFGYDDALDVVGVHCVGGSLGAVLTGIFATREVTDAAVSGGNVIGLIEGGSLLGAQIGAVLLTWTVGAVGSFILLKLIDVTIGVRVSPEGEMKGLDLTDHREEGYIFV
jgi:Amt family ammonium transporter